MEITCKNPKCEAVFEQRRRNQVFCSRRCSWTLNNATIATRPGALAAKIESSRRYREKNRDKLNASSNARRASMPEHVRDLERTNEAKRRSALRQRVIAELGGKCATCGFDDWRAMQVDHVNGGGHQDRKKVGRYSYWIQVLEAPEGTFQLLCANCNQIKRYEKGEGVGKRSTPTKHKRKY